jgi:hypothetical protein
MRRAKPRTGPGEKRVSAFDQPDLSGARAFPGFLRRKLHPLAFTQKLEYGAADGASMEEMLDPSFVADESEPLVDKKPRDRPGWHNPNPPALPGSAGTSR